MRQPSKRNSDHDKGALLEALLAQIPLLYFRLKNMAQAVHGEGEVSGARRSVLRSLAERPATVPALANERPVARQVMQRLVNGLIADALVELVDNPIHLKSKVVVITDLGRAALEEMKRREKHAAAALFADFSEAEIGTALAVAKTLTDRLTEMEFVPASEKARPPSTERRRAKNGSPGLHRRK